MNGTDFYQHLTRQLNEGDVIHTGKNGAHYTFQKWYRGNLQFAGTQTKSIAKHILIAVKDALNENQDISAEWLRQNELESFASRVALLKSIIRKYGE